MYLNISQCRYFFSSENSHHAFMFLTSHQEYLRTTRTAWCPDDGRLRMEVLSRLL